ncbi:diguanylate cyclase domain-containing protein [Gallaecimonas mangrovi]|uniref:diguanylate cyclase domain-containing protein n=1 Tax=Gallaecimonas mangrovi TaxID=2291597 RepID=UPI000E1FCF85|nr:diguanylate cyclase [Gallaecimonas mangrovi]
MQHRQTLTSTGTRILAVAIFVISCSAVELFFHLIDSNRQAQERAQIITELGNLRTKIESHSNAALYLVRGLSAYIKANPQASQAQITPILKNMYEDGKSIRSIAVAPDLIIQTVYPLQGNEKVLGVDFRKVPSQWPYVEKAINLKSTVLDGPVNLIQGGRGLINRTPIFLDNGKLWGVVSVVLDIDNLLKQAGIYDEPTSLKLYLYNPKKPENSTIYGDKRVLNDSNRVSQPLSLNNETWILSGAGTLATKTPWWTLAGHLLGWLLSIALAVMYYVIMREHGLNKLLANSDSLTDLPNRRAFYNQVKECLGEYKKENRGFGILYMDLNGFKHINDTYGHEVGDDVLITTAKRLRQACRQGDQYFRLGGDEFVAILPAVSSKEEADHIGERILAAMKRDIVINSQLTLSISAAVGSAFPEPKDTIDSLLARADNRMYKDKRGNKPAVDFSI